MYLVVLYSKENKCPNMDRYIAGDVTGASNVALSVVERLCY